MYFWIRVIKRSPAGFARLEEVSDEDYNVIGYRVVYKDTVLPMQETREKAEELFKFFLCEKRVSSDTEAHPH